MRAIRTICILAVLLVSAPVLLSARIQDGMLFRSYDVPAEERTSLQIPGKQKEWITFADSLSLSFSVKIELNKGRFGYICRIGLDDLLPIDFILSPQGGKPEICATADHLNLVSLNDEGENVEEWKDFYVKVFEDDGNLVLTANGRDVFRGVFAAKRHRVKFYFGRCDSEGFATSDVAPMILADLQLKADNGRTHSWLLSEESELESHSGVSIKATNGLFLKDFNRRWTNVFSTETPSVTYSCYSRDGSTVYFISDHQIIKIDVASASQTVIPYSKDMKLNFVRDNFEVLPDGNLIYADVERGEFIRFDPRTGDWVSDNSRTRTSTLLHNNSLWLESEGKYIHLFGYGQHKYSNTAYIWSPADMTVSAMDLTGVAPRYLAAAGVKDGRIYILGGKGNADGRQELGVQTWDDFCEIDPADGSARTLWHSDLMKSNVAAKDLVFEDGGESFLALVYNPDVHDSFLQLTRFSFADGTFQKLADKLPYSFSDVSSEARLHYNAEFEMYSATLCQAGNDGKYHVDVYVLGAPILECPSDAAPSARRIWIWIAVAVLVLALFAALILYRRRGKAHNLDVPREIDGIYMPDKPGVYLLGGFHVLDKDCNDITSSFSPILMQLLSILVLHTAEKGGISNAMLKSLLWPDKSDESFNNNKGVNLSRLRTLLEQVGGISVVSEGGTWHISEENGICDYTDARRKLSEGNIQEILKVASRGALLPEYHFEWLDAFKSNYTNLVFSRLDQIVASGVSPEVVVRMSDARLLFDSLDEEAVQQKCKALVSLGKVGLAKSVFSRFTSEYKNVMQEEISEDFTDFIKKNLR
ncbi:MAG: hypothetical protein J6X71_02150 [Bacteroidales bacterium]|nr:hypothetical protein [Bacteroidales bacterium]